MKLVYKLNGRTITRAQAAQEAGADRLARMEKDADETWAEHPLIQCDWMVRNGTLSIGR